MNEYNDLPIVIFGTGGASKDAYYWIKNINDKSKRKVFDVRGFVGESHKQIGDSTFADEIVITCDEELEIFAERYEQLGLIIPFGSPKLRESVAKKTFGNSKFIYPNIIHPSVVIDYEIGTMGIGNHIGPGSVFLSTYTIGDFNYINGDVLLGHDIKMNNFNSINPSASTAGNVTLGNRNTIGIGATVIQELSIPDDVTIGAGTVVIRNCDSNRTYVGNPARSIK